MCCLISIGGRMETEPGPRQYEGWTRKQPYSERQYVLVYRAAPCTCCGTQWKARCFLKAGKLIPRRIILQQFFHARNKTGWIFKYTLNNQSRNKQCCESACLLSCRPLQQLYLCELDTCTPPILNSKVAILFWLPVGNNLWSTILKSRTFIAWIWRLWTLRILVHFWQNAVSSRLKLFRYYCDTVSMPRLRTTPY
jgi:hypothetical protein